MERLAAGFHLAEAPVWDGERLWVSDALGGGVRAMALDGTGTAVLAPERRGVGGAAVHGAGGLVASGRDLSLIDEAGQIHLVAGRPDGCTGFNDIAPTPAGGLLAGGLTFRPFAGDPPAPGILLHLAPDGETQTWDAGTILWPNGIAFSPEGDAVYACDYHRGVVLRSPWHPGEAAALELWWQSPSGQADGLAVDSEGHVLVAMGTAGTLGRVAPDGTLDSTIDVPAPFVASCAFAGSNLELLVATTAGERFDQPGGGVFVGSAPVPGSPLPPVTISV